MCFRPADAVALLSVVTRSPPLQSGYCPGNDAPVLSGVVDEFQRKCPTNFSLS
jgi:hypothetical protein